MNNSKLTAAGLAAIAALSFTGMASAETCVEKATRLRAEVDTQPTSERQVTLSQSLALAMGADEKRCEEILAQADDDLKSTGDGHASADKPLPNYPNASGQPATGPGMSDSAARSGSEEGHASEDDPIPNQPTRDVPAAVGPSGTNTSSQSTMDEGETGHATGDDPIPNVSSNSDDDPDAGNED
jgi:hypothetical protein